jgi:hypothetical protein
MRTRKSGSPRLALACLLAAGAAFAESSTEAIIVQPGAGSQLSGLPQSFTWTAAAAAERYYLYVGSSPGAKDIVDTGEMPSSQLSFTAAYLPPGATLFARVWTRASGAWVHSGDVPFSLKGASTLASLTQPTNGAQLTGLPQTFAWSPTAAASKYYLYVGSSPGGKDIVDTGELEASRSSFSASYLPTGVPLYARLWSKLSGSWQHGGDVSFSLSGAPSLGSLTQPTNGSQLQGLPQTFTWTPASAASHYYLYVGTSPGSKDVVDTGELPGSQVSFTATHLPAGATLHARLWSKLSGSWQHGGDVSFSLSGGSALASLTQPTSGAQLQGLPQTFTWTAASAASHYYLYVGTSPGSQDVVDTGELPGSQLSFTAPYLPAGTTLYARIWSKLLGSWRPGGDVAFTVTGAPSLATLTQPTDGAQLSGLPQNFTWDKIPAAANYYLYIGTSPGARNVVDTGELPPSQSSFTAPVLPAGVPLYAKLWTKTAGAWRAAEEVAFTVTNPPPVATLTYPTEGSELTSPWENFTWDPSVGASAYYLYVGTAPGLRDVVDSGALPASSSSYAIPRLPHGATLYARLFTQTGGLWVNAPDVPFSVQLTAPILDSPADGSVTPSAVFSWTALNGAEGFRLKLGTDSGQTDIWDSGSIVATETSITPPISLPSGVIIFARLETKLAGVWEFDHDTTFSIQADDVAPHVVYPVDDAGNVDTAQPFQWEPIAGATAYRLIIGTNPGASDIYDSGAIRVPRRFVGALPIGQVLEGTASVLLGGTWRSTSFRFTVEANTQPGAALIESAQWAVSLVRAMASSNDVPITGTLLATVSPVGLTCLEYSRALRLALDEMAIPADHRLGDTCFNANSLDCHTFVELLDPATGRWIILDPTFDMSPDLHSGAPATTQEMCTATANRDWSAITYRALSSRGLREAAGYYLDYPLLYLNVVNTASPSCGETPSPLPYTTVETLPYVGAPSAFAVECGANSAVVNMVVNGVETTMPCDGLDRLTPVFQAGSVSVSATETGSVTLRRPQRFVH